MSSRRELVRVSPTLVISRDYSPKIHDDPAYRGAYLLLLPGKVPEIVLDGLANELEQREAERRCLLELERRLETGSAPQAGNSHRSMNSGHLVGSRGSPSRPRNGLIGQRLVADGLLSVESLQKMLEYQRSLPEDRPVRRLGSLLVEAGLLTMRQISDALGAQRGVQASTGQNSRLEPGVQNIFLGELLLQVQAVPLGIIGKTLAVAMADPHDERQVAQLQSLTKLFVRPIQAPQLQVHRLLESMKSSRSSIRRGTTSQGGDIAASRPPASPNSRRGPDVSSSSREGTSAGSARSVPGRGNLSTRSGQGTPAPSVVSRKSRRQLSSTQRTLFLAALLIGASFVVSTGFILKLHSANRGAIQAGAASAVPHTLHPDASENNDESPP